MIILKQNHKTKLKKKKIKSVKDDKKSDQNFS